jgi:hypothetical protein
VIAGNDGAVLVCGSLYLAAELRPLIADELIRRNKTVLSGTKN